MSVVVKRVRTGGHGNVESGNFELQHVVTDAFNFNFIDAVAMSELRIKMASSIQSSHMCLSK